MTDAQEHALAVLRDIDACFHRLFEAVDNADETAATPVADPITILRRVRSQIDAALLDQHRRTDDKPLPDGGSCVLQWTPSDTPPRRLVLEPDGDGDKWTRRELEWTGAGWRTCRRDTIRDVAISAPAEPRYPDPVDPPILDTLLALIRGTWTNPDPDVLVFDTLGMTEQGVLVAVDGELRYRDAGSPQWYTVTNEAELSHHLQQKGQPVVQSLSETSLTRQHFTPSPLTDDEG
ncbi:hypothetical protein GCM10008995_25300 [Halobellus salinus]|uniref:Uncharacterized protein n=1 Tax=Halobellus salinus TaxID=931585 RepID=A0A830EDP3_9EURY|nr:hypothetical protein [Halobellus salinus]GGJ14313.1 hypothetical protein GCM10008995_25300 [Halobellus salinus]SMP29700.1 hypothetical protein SAMN06265347_11514 [Halobellus salinus]